MVQPQDGLQLLLRRHRRANRACASTSDVPKVPGHRVPESAVRPRPARPAMNRGPTSRDGAVGATLKCWRTIAKEVDCLTDRLGKRVDRGIKAAVVALRALGFRTRASCQGHLTWGIKAPWVDIGVIPPAKLLRSLMDDPKKHSHPEIRSVRTENLKEQERLFSILEQFYRARKYPAVGRIILVPHSYGAVRLINQLADIQEILPASRRAARLRRFQAEINDFAAFLKRRYFEDRRAARKPGGSRTAPTKTKPHS